VGGGGGGADAAAAAAAADPGRRTPSHVLQLRQLSTLHSREGRGERERTDNGDQGCLETRAIVFQRSNRGVKAKADDGGALCRPFCCLHNFELDGFTFTRARIGLSKFRPGIVSRLDFSLAALIASTLRIMLRGIYPTNTLVEINSSLRTDVGRWGKGKKGKREKNNNNNKQTVRERDQILLLPPPVAGVNQ
jgi:hypothetical protein